MEDTIYNLYSKSEKFWLAFMTGGMKGRKLKVWNYYADYFSFFYRLSTNLFKYYGVDDILAREIERRLFYFGKVGIITHEKKLVAVNANTYEPDIYGRPEKFTFSFMNGEKDNKQFRRTIGVDGVLGINTYEYYPTALLAEHYAYIIAHADATVVSNLVNLRMADILKATTQTQAEKANTYLNKVFAGEQGVIIDSLEDMEVIRQTSAKMDTGEALEVRNDYLRDFFNLIGVNRFEEKKERVVVDEVNANVPMLKLDIADMLHQRKKMCEDIARVFEVNCEVVPLVDIDGDNIIEGGAEDV